MSNKFAVAYKVVEWVFARREDKLMPYKQRHHVSHEENDLIKMYVKG